MRAGLIPDPYLDDNESLLAWIGLVDWTYEHLASPWTPRLRPSAHDLVVRRASTPSRAVSLNGTSLAEVANQHRSLPARRAPSALVEGDNHLAVRLPLARSGTPTHRASLLGARPRPYPLPYEAIRKSACSFGWDWGIATFTSGIWRPLRARSWSTARLAQVRVHAEPRGDRRPARASTCAWPAPPSTPSGDRDARASRRCRPARCYRRATEVARVRRPRVPDVELWWPAGLRRPAALRRRRRASSPRRRARLDARDARGFPHPALGHRARMPRAPPSQLVVNDRPIFVKGVNWIPDDALPRPRRPRPLRAPAASRRRTRTSTSSGSGAAASTSPTTSTTCATSSACSTWQDFLFACAAYPEEEPLRSEIEAEARQNVVAAGPPRLARAADRQQREPLGPRGLGVEGAPRRPVLGRVLLLRPAARHRRRARAARALRPGQPVQPGPGTHAPRTPRQHGSMHLWEQWNSPDWTDVPRRAARGSSPSSAGRGRRRGRR